MKFYDVIRDKVTGFQGVYYGRSEYANGCVRIGIKSQELNDGKPLEIEWIDESQIEVVKNKNVPAHPAGDGTDAR